MNYDFMAILFCLIAQITVPVWTLDLETRNLYYAEALIAYFERYDYSDSRRVLNRHHSAFAVRSDGEFRSAS